MSLWFGLTIAQSKKCYFSSSFLDILPTYRFRDREKHISNSFPAWTTIKILRDGDLVNGVERLRLWMRHFLLKIFFVLFLQLKSWSVGRERQDQPDYLLGEWLTWKKSQKAKGGMRNLQTERKKGKTKERNIFFRLYKTT